MPRLFISHSNKNAAETIALRDWLVAEGWDDLFLDLDPARGAVPGEQWERKLVEAIEGCDIVLFLVSQGWLDSDWCQKEFRLTYRTNKRFLSILLEDIPIKDLPQELTATYQLADLAKGHDHRIFWPVLPDSGREHHVTFSQSGLAQLKNGLNKVFNPQPNVTPNTKSDETGPDPYSSPWPPASDPDRSPYRGMRPMEAEDAGVFFGREAPILDLLDILRGPHDKTPPRFLVILGASGSGKSSFLRAGILPRLSRDAHRFLPLPIIRPEQAVLTGENGLLHCLEQAFKRCQIVKTRKELRDAIDTGIPSLSPLFSQLANHAQPATSPPPTLIFSIDQGEELFLAEGTEESQPFLTLLKELVLYGTVNLTILLTIRSDTYERLQQAKPLEGVRQATFSLSPMPRGAYHTVITGPMARLASTSRPLQIDPKLTEALLQDSDHDGGKDALPLLAYTLERLYLDYGAGGELNLTQYREMGGIQGAIEAAVKQAFTAAARDPALPRDRADQLLLLRRGLIPWLAGIDPDTQAPRRRVAKLAEIPVEAQPMIKHLIEQRLLATDVEQETGEKTIEPAHEALLRQWGLLQGWLQEDSAALATLEGVKRSAKEWETHKHQHEWLTHTAGRLDDAEHLKQRNDLTRSFTDCDWDYLKACREQNNQRRNKELEEARKLAEALKSVQKLAERECAEAVAARRHAEDLINYMLFDLRDKLAPIGRLEVLEMVSRKALDYFKQFPASSDMSQKQQRNLAVGKSNLGDVLVAQGDLEEALAAYRNAMEIFKRLAAIDPMNAGWQRDLSVSHNKIGDVLQQQGDLTNALAAYREDMEITKRLAAMEPNNTEWQRDLSVSHGEIGDVLQQQGDLTNALAAYRDSMEIRKRLAAIDPENAGWQRDLSVSHIKIGDVLQEQGNLPNALAAYRDSIKIAKLLAAMEPNNAGWQRDLSVSHSKIGDVLQKQGELTNALAAYHDAMEIAKRLAAMDPKNAGWQRDLAISHERMGLLLAKKGQLPEAAAHFQQEIAIIEAIFKKFPDQQPFQFDLDFPRNNLREILNANGSTTE
ncbi:MAG: toll/interleukin-1 receptor domain-containing protein [Magnetococcus sp. THC-1_WYH]